MEPVGAAAAQVECCKSTGMANVAYGSKRAATTVTDCGLRLLTID